MTGAHLVLDRCDCSVLSDFDGVGSTRQPPTLRPKGDTPQDGSTSLDPSRSGIDTAVPVRASDGVPIVLPDAVDVDEGTLSRAVLVVLQG
jgi:hypothetical protein